MPYHLDKRSGVGGWSISGWLDFCCNVRRSDGQGDLAFAPCRGLFLAPLLTLLFGASMPAAAQSPSTVPVVTIAGGSAVYRGADATFTLTAPLVVKVHAKDNWFTWYGRWHTRWATIGTSGTGSFTVDTSHQDWVEWHDEMVTIVAASGNRYSVVSPSSASVAVKDWLLPRTATMFADPSEVTEGEEFKTILEVRPLWRGTILDPKNWQVVKEKLKRTGAFMRHEYTDPNFHSKETVNLNKWLQGDGTGKGEFTWVGFTNGDSYWPHPTVDDSIDEPGGTFTMRTEWGDGLTTNSVTVSIRDNDPTVVSLARMGSGAVSAGEAFTFRMTLGRALVKGEIIDVPLVIFGAGVSVDGYTLSVRSGTGAALSATNTLTPNLRFSGAGARTATLELIPSTTGTCRIVLGPDGTGANSFDQVSLGTNVPMWAAERTPARRTTVSA